MKKDEKKRLLGLLEKKLDCLRQYLSIARAIRGVLAEKAGGQIHLLISEREGCIQRVNGIDRSMRNLLRPNGRDRGRKSAAFRELIEYYAEKTRRVMEEASSLDREITGLIRAECGTLRAELFHVQRVRQAAHGYRMHQRPSPRFLDTMR